MLKKIWKKLVDFIVSDVPAEVECCEFCHCHKAYGCSKEEKGGCEQLKIESR